MRKTFLVLSLTATLAAALLVMSAGIASADPGNGDGASVNHEAWCFVNFPAISALTYQAIRVDSASGNTVLTCHFRADGVQRGGIPSSLLRYEGFMCTIDGRPTTDSVFQMNTDGNGLMRCEIKANPQG